MRSTAGPLEQMLQSLPTTADQINEALQAIDVQAIGDINDGLTEAAARFIKLGGVAGRVLQDIFSGVMKILLAKYLDAPIAGLLGKILNIGVSVASAGSGGGGGGFKDTSSLPKFAAGGSLAIGGMGGVDANLLSINGVPRAMVDRSERLDVVPANDRGGGRGGITVHVHQSNNFAGGAATMEDVVKIAGVTKQATIGAVMDMKRRGAFR